jgi:hypothetical protein
VFFTGQASPSNTYKEYQKKWTSSFVKFWQKKLALRRMDPERKPKENFSRTAKLDA